MPVIERLLVQRSSENTHTAFTALGSSESLRIPVDELVFSKRPSYAHCLLSADSIIPDIVVSIAQRSLDNLAGILQESTKLGRLENGQPFLVGQVSRTVSVALSFGCPAHL